MNDWNGNRVSGFLLISPNLSSCLFIDAFPGTNGNDLDGAFAEPIDDSTSSQSQTPIPFKLLFECFPTGRVVKYVG